MNGNSANDNAILIALNILANLTQLESYKLLQKDLNNTDLMHELQRQDSEYLEKIIKQNEQIIALLEGRKWIEWKTKRLKSS